ncbi:MAG: DUF1206 domain-containing protein [Wenzhouxiangella sp.]
MSRILFAGRSLVEVLARLGYLAKGTVFLAVGLLALLALAGFGEGRITGSDGGIHVIGRSLPGRWGFGLLAVGLSAHVFWRIYQVIMDPASRGFGLAGVVQRAGLLVSAGFYTSMVIVTLSAVTGLISRPDSSQDVAALWLDKPGGPALFGLLGVVVIGVALYQGWRAVGQPFRAQWLGRRWMGWSHGALALVASFGIAVRALLFLLIGWSFLRAGWFSSSDEMTDVATALWRMSRDEYGGWKLGAVALGLLCYGLYCWMNAALKRIEFYARKRRSTQEESA